MKIRTMKLREAHMSGLCTILWDSKAEHIVTASSSDNSICIHDALSPSNTPKFIRNHREGVTALALTPNSSCLASGSLDRSVKLYKFPAGDFETNITRFTLPLRTLAFNKSGTILAAAGDDEGIKLVNTIDGTIARVLKGHKGSVTSLAFDPKSEYLASVDSIGTVIFWELQSGTTIHTLKGIAPNNGSDVSKMNILAWSPDGEMLAVPGLKNDVVLHDRDTAEKLFSLRGDHYKSICFLSWSPNGKYMATSGLDKQVLIWDVDKKQDIDRQNFSECVSCMAWKPHGNALAVIDVTGKYGVLESAVPSSMKSPTEDIPSLHSKNNNGLLLFDEDEKASVSGSLSDFNEDSHDESELPSKNKLLKKPKYVDELEEDFNDELESIPKVESQKKSKKGDLNYKKNGSKKVLKMQEAFQSGATPAQPGKRHFLCYNLLGSITSMEHDGYSHIETDFHDTSSNPRVPAMTDYFGFTMASLNEKGCVFANPCKGEKSMSTLMYRPFSSWANNSEWSMRFEGEEVKAIALGSAWVAAVTSLNFLLIFTEGGLQRSILSLDGPVVTAAGYKDELAIVTHISPPIPSYEQQMLEFWLFNVPSGTQPLKGRLPLTPGSCLTWFGFSKEGQLSSFDSKGVLRVFDQYGGNWLPLFSASKLKKKEENYWVVGLNASKVYCIVCKAPEYFPQSTPKPFLTLLDLSFPLPSSDLGADALENEFLMKSMHLARIQKRIEEISASGHDTTSLDDEAFNLEVSLDKCILKLIGSCCNGDKLVKAVELVALLSHEKSVRGAIKLVTLLKLPNLAERFSNILEEKLLNEKNVSTIPTQIKSSSSNDSIKAASAPAKIFTTPETSKAQQIVVPSPIHKISSPFFTKKRKSEEQTKGVENTVDVKPTVESKDATEGRSVEKTKKVKDLDQLVSNRPSNPFAKSSSKQESPSLFDSLKKMKKTDIKGKK